MMPSLPPRLRALLFPALALTLCVAAWRSYGAQGLLLAVLMLSFWVLLHFTKLMRLLRAAASRPIGAVAEVPTLQSQLRLGMALHDVIRRTACLGERLNEPVGADVESFCWSDEKGRRLLLRFEAGRLRQIDRQDANPVPQAASNASAEQP